MKEFVWYSPEFDLLYIDNKECGAMFKNEYGSFHVMYFKADNDFLIEPFRPVEFYLVGKYE